MYNAVGIDVSKGKSTVTVLQPGGTVIRKPFDVSDKQQCGRFTPSHKKSLQTQNGFRGSVKA